MTVMSNTKRNLILGLYLPSQFLAIGSAFSGSMLSIYDYKHPNLKVPVPLQDYVWIFGLGLIAASIGSIIAYTFQGKKIGAPEEKQSSIPEYPYDLAPQNRKSKLAESSFLCFAFSLVIANNYLQIAGLNAFFNNSSDSILPPEGIGLTIFALKTLLIDLPFNGTNAIYEANEEIKKIFTDSKAGPLLSRLLRPIAASPTLFFAFIKWLQIAGVGVHTISDITGFALSIPSLLSFIPSMPQVDTVKSFVATPGLMYPIILISVTLYVFNYIQTLYFEGKESEINVSRLRPYNRFRSSSSTKGNRVIRKGLTMFPASKRIISVGFLTQAPLHGFGDLLPTVLLMRDLFERHDSAKTPFNIFLMISLSILVFTGSCLGTYHSEVKTAVDHFNNDFKDIGSLQHEYNHGL